MSGRFDTANIKIDHFDRAPLMYDDKVLAYLTRHFSDAEILKVPGFRYWELGEERKMDRPDNICGYQQRAFEFYWSTRCAAQEGLIMLGVGTGSIGAPGMLTTDLFNGESPHRERYPSNNGFSHLKADAQDLSTFYPCKFAGVVANHVIEHLQDTEKAVREWLRVTRPGGYVCIIQPDMAFNGRGTIDPTHVNERSADEFYRELVAWGLVDTQISALVEHNTLDNAFSFNTVLRKIDIGEESR